MKIRILYSLIVVLVGSLICMLGCTHTSPSHRKTAQEAEEVPAVVLVNEGALQHYKKGKFFIIYQCNGNTELSADNKCEIKPDSNLTLVPEAEFVAQLKQELIGSGKVDDVIKRLHDFNLRYAELASEPEEIDKLKASEDLKNDVVLFVDEVLTKNLKKYVVSKDSKDFDFNFLGHSIINKRLTADFIKIQSVVCKKSNEYSYSDVRGLTPDPKHTSAFEVQSTVVTQAQYYSITTATPSYFKNSIYCNEEHITAGKVSLCPNHPVEKVSWNEAKGFIDKLNIIDKSYSYRLPTENELDCAIRAGTKTAYWFGEDANLLENYAWYEENADARTHAVGSCPNKDVDCKNPWGLYDAHGNVWQWVSDSFSMTNRVMLGGSYNYNRNALRSDYRHSNDKKGQVRDTGFRLVRTPKN